MSDLTWPVTVALLFGVLTFFIKKIRLRAVLACGGFALHLMLCLVLLWQTGDGEITVTAVGEWQPPYGITLVADLFASIILCTISLIFLSCCLYSVEEEDVRQVHNLRYPLMFILLAAVSLSILTGDFFNLFVSFEMMLAASYSLVVLELADKHLKWGYSYLLVNLLGTLGFLCAAAMIYGYTGQLNIAALSTILQGEVENPLLQGWAYILLGVFGLKAGLFPLYYWLPKTYASLPAPISALFAGTLTKVGVYVLMRMFILVLPGLLGHIDMILLGVSILSMLIGVIGALGCATIRSILSFHIISQIGYMTLGLSLYTPAAVAGALIFIIHNIWVKVSLYLIGGVAQEACDSDDLKKMRGLSLLTPGLAFCFLLQALSLVGLPPLSGFWGKYVLISASISQEQYLAAGAALLTSFLTLLSMVKIWMAAFWGEKRVKRHSAGVFTGKRQLSSYGILIAASMLLGVGVEPFYRYSYRAAEQLFAKEAYIQTVLKTRGKGLL